MKKTLKLTLFSMMCVFVITGCSSNDDLEEGIELYNESSFDSMVEARKFFVDYRDNSTDGKKANKWIKKIDKKLGDVAKDRVEVLYGEFRFEEALELTEILLEITPDDESIKEVKTTIESDYKKQLEFDDFSSFLEEKYDEIYYLFELWNKEIEDGIINNTGTSRLVNATKQMLPIVSELREEIQSKNLTVSNDVFYENQDKLFQYINRLESELTRLIVNEPERTMDYRDGNNSFSPELFNKTFIDIQNSVNGYVNELDDDDNRVNFIDGLIEFKKLDEIQVDDVPVGDDDGDDDVDET